MKVSLKNKLRLVLEKMHIVNFGKMIYCLHYKKRHKKQVKYSKKRAKGWNDKRFTPLLALHNKYLNERCFIVCTGPSLKIADVNMLKNEYTFGMNSIFKLYDKTDWRPTFYAIQDEKVYDKIKNTPEFEKIPNKIVADFIAESFSIDLSKNILFPLDLMDHHSYKMKEFNTIFSDNAYNIVYDGASITYSIFQLAYYLGFRQIYLIGCDCDYSGSKQHFCDIGLKANDNPEIRMKLGYEKAQKFCEENDLKIFNATRGGKLEVFPRVNFDDVIKEKC